MSNSLTGWWQAAGLHSAVSEAPRNWLMADLAIEVAEKPVEHTEIPAARSDDRPKAVADALWPDDLKSLQKAVAAGMSLPGNMFGGKRATPVGEAGAGLMIVSDLPDADELTAGRFGEGASGQLLRAMLAACGIELASCYWTALATTAPASGELPEASYNELAAFVRHQIGLVQPAALLLLGTAATRAMLGVDMFDARGSLRDFNHDGGNKAVLASFHPRTLIAQPNLKAKAWEDLQVLSSEESP